MEHELYNKTDKQLLKVGKVELLAYIRELEGTINNQGDTNVMQDCDCETGLVSDIITQDTKHLTSYVIGDNVESNLYKF